MPRRSGSESATSLTWRFPCNRERLLLFWSSNGLFLHHEAVRASSVVFAGGVGLFPFRGERPSFPRVLPRALGPARCSGTQCDCAGGTAGEDSGFARKYCGFV